jgi:DNA-binding HxlR family transcriptional regulator
MNAVDEHKIDFPALARFTRRAALMHKLSSLERDVIEFLLEWSYGRGKLVARIERDTQMAALAGMTNQQLSRTLKGLATANLIEISQEQTQKKKDEVRKNVYVTVYKIVQPIGQWRRVWRPVFRVDAGKRAAIEKDLQALIGDIQDLLWPEESLADTVTLEQFGVTPHGRITPDCTPPGAANPAQDRNAPAGGARLAAEMQQCLIPAFVCYVCGQRIAENWVNASVGTENAAAFRERWKAEGVLRYPGLKHKECLPTGRPAGLSAQGRVDDSSTLSGATGASHSMTPAQVDERSTYPPTSSEGPAKCGEKVDQSSTFSSDGGAAAAVAGQEVDDSSTFPSVNPEIISPKTGSPAPNLEKVDERSTPKAGNDQLRPTKVDESSTFSPKQKPGCTNAPARDDHDHDLKHDNDNDNDHVMIKGVLNAYALKHRDRARSRDLTLDERDFLLAAQEFVGLEVMAKFLGPWHKWLYLGFVDDAVEALHRAKMMADSGQIRKSRGGTLWSVFCSYAYQTISSPQLDK